MKTRALQGARLHQHGDSTIFMKLPPCEQVNLMLRSLAARAHGFVFGQNSVGMYAFTLSGDGTICQEGKGERAAGVHLSGAPNSRELMTSPTLLCSQQGHRHQPLMLIEGEGFGCEALRCLWMSKAWEAHSAGLCAPSQVWWRPPMDLRRAAADETPRRALTGGSGSDSASDVTFASRHNNGSSHRWLSVRTIPDPPIPRFRDDTVAIQLVVFLLSTITPNTGANWILHCYQCLYISLQPLVGGSRSASLYYFPSLSLHPSDTDGGNVCGARRLQRPPRLFASGCSRLRTKPSGFIYVRLCSRTL